MKTTTIQMLAPSNQPVSFRMFLQAELAKRCASNPQYSLRAFARSLGTDHATLSQLLRGKRRLTPNTIEKFGSRLRMEPNVIADFVTTNDLLGDRLGGTVATPEVRQLANDVASLIADGHHYAILELTRLDEFVPDSRWIGRVLGISADEVNVAVTRLIRLDLLEMSGGRWIDKSGAATQASIDDFAQAALRKLTEQASKLLLAAARRHPAGVCEHSSTMVAVNAARLPELIALIAGFRQQLHVLLEREEPRDDVYQINISVFPVTTLMQDKENDHGPTGNAISDSGSKPRQGRRVLRKPV